MKVSNLIASISIIPFAISLLIIIPIRDYLRIIIGVIWIFLQLVSLYKDYKRSEEHSGTDIFRVGFFGYLIGGWHINARLGYWLNGLLLILGIFINLIFQLIWSFLFYIFSGGNFTFSIRFYPNEITVIVIWSVSFVLNICAAVIAVPPRKLEGYKMICRDALYQYLTQYRGKAFSANTLRARVSVLGLKLREREYYKEHIKEVLDSLVSSYEKVLTTVQNEKLYYFIPPAEN